MFKLKSGRRNGKSKAFIAYCKEVEADLKRDEKRWKEQFARQLYK